MVRTSESSLMAPRCANSRRDESCANSSSTNGSRSTRSRYVDLCACRCSLAATTPGGTVQRLVLKNPAAEREERVSDVPLLSSSTVPIGEGPLASRCHAASVSIGAVG